jgi:hypothetical protein
MQPATEVGDALADGIQLDHDCGGCEKGGGF